MPFVNAAGFREGTRIPLSRPTISGMEAIGVETICFPHDIHSSIDIGGSTATCSQNGITTILCELTDSESLPGPITWSPWIWVFSTNLRSSLSRTANAILTPGNTDLILGSADKNVLKPRPVLVPEIQITPAWFSFSSTCSGSDSLGKPYGTTEIWPAEKRSSEINRCFANSVRTIT